MAWPRCNCIKNPTSSHIAAKLLRSLCDAPANSDLMCMIEGDLLYAASVNIEVSEIILASLDDAYNNME